jgi:hypothetical protein
MPTVVTKESIFHKAIAVFSYSSAIDSSTCLDDLVVAWRVLPC